MLSTRLSPEELHHCMINTNNHDMSLTHIVDIFYLYYWYTGKLLENYGKLYKAGNSLVKPSDKALG